jgi:hypothetical protein
MPAPMAIKIHISQGPAQAELWCISLVRSRICKQHGVTQADSPIRAPDVGLAREHTARYSISHFRVVPDFHIYNNSQRH